MELEYFLGEWDTLVSNIPETEAEPTGFVSKQEFSFDMELGTRADAPSLYRISSPVIGSFIKHVAQSHHEQPNSQAIDFSSFAHPVDAFLKDHVAGQPVLSGSNIQQSSPNKNRALDLPCDTESNVGFKVDQIPFTNASQLAKYQIDASQPQITEEMDVLVTGSNFNISSGMPDQAARFWPAFPDRYFHQFPYTQQTASNIWQPIPNDASMPYSPEHQQFYTRKLLAAIISTSQSEDRMCNAMRVRWAYISSYSPSSSAFLLSTLEHLAWRLLSFAIALHTHGSSALSSHSRILLLNAYKERTLSFEQRIQKVCEVLARSKSRCEKLLGGLHAQFVVACPETCRARIRNNGKQNGNRQKLLQKGKEVTKSLNLYEQ